jgi:hypothetical protein
MTLFPLLIAAAVAAPVPPNSTLNEEGRPWRIELGGELGFLAPLSHTIQFGNDGTDFDYVEEGGQDNLFFVSRWSLDFRLKERTTLTFLYQPLNIETQQTATRDLRFDGIDFVEGTPINMRYGFDFYRASYTYDLFPDDKRELGIGASLQIRNATIGFSSADGELRTINRDIGPVPVIKVRGRFEGDQRNWWGFEVDGFYAPIKYLNGGSTDVVGAILDASLRAGLKASNGVEPFVNLRYLGGGADGTSSDPDPGKDGYNKNWLNFMTVTFGVYLR